MVKLNKQMSARQKHGFEYENHCCSTYALTKEENYTNNYDAYTLNGISIQIKFIKNKSEVSLGDYTRNKNKTEPFILHVAFYTDKTDLQNVTIHTFHIHDFEKWNSLFEFEYDIPMKQEMKLITNLRDDDGRWKTFRTKYGKLWNTPTRIIGLRFKRDHKTQKRLQCAIPYKKFVSHFLKLFNLIDIKTVNNMSKHTGLNRIVTDQFYTNKNAVELCINTLKSTIKIRKNDLIIEPSAGNGAFVNEIKNLCTNYLFYDIEPKNDEIITQNFLNLSFSGLEKYKNIHFLGNPPFGRQSSLAIKFIKKASEKAKTISFILPKSFKKNSMQAHFPDNFWLMKEIDLPANSFTVNGQTHDAPCIFQIWKKRSKKRAKPEKLIPEKFQFVKQDETPDIAVRRVGVNAGKIINIKSDIDKASIQSHYFITFESRDLEHNISLLKLVSFNHDNTVGPRSISKQELLCKYNQVL